MDAVLVGVLTALTAALGATLWYLLVDPQSVLAVLLGNAAAHDTWFDEHPLTIQVLRWAAGLSLCLLGFLTGLATAFLSSTG